MTTENLSSLSDAKLLAQTEQLVREERRITLAVLKHFEEIESRQLFARQGYSSLLEMCMKKFSYSESAAVRRIDGMRLLKKLPQVEAKIEEGRIRLSQLAQLQGFLRTEQNDAGRTYSPQQTLDLVEQIQGRSTRDTDRWLLEKSPALQLRRELSQAKGPELIPTHIAVDAEMSVLIQAMRRIAPPNADPSATALIKLALREWVKQGGQVPEPPATNTGTVEAAAHVLRTASARARIRRAVKYVPASIRKAVFLRAKGRCEYQSPVDGGRCSNRFALELHQHVIPESGTTPTPETISVYCRAHHAAHRRWKLTQPSRSSSSTG